MMEWIRSTSGRMALRVSSIGLPQGSQPFPRLAQRLVHAIRSGAAGNIVARQDSIELELGENVWTEGRAELAQLIELEILEFTTLGDAFLYVTSQQLVG